MVSCETKKVFKQLKPNEVKDAFDKIVNSEELNLRIFGSADNLLFIPSDIREICEIQQQTLQDRIAKFTDREILKDCIVELEDDNGRISKYYGPLLTKYGLYRTLYMSNKPAARKFGKLIEIAIKKLHEKNHARLDEIFKKLKSSYDKEFAIMDNDNAILAGKERMMECIGSIEHDLNIREDFQVNFSDNKELSYLQSFDKIFLHIYSKKENEFYITDTPISEIDFETLNKAGEKIIDISFFDKNHYEHFVELIKPYYAKEYENFPNGLYRIEFEKLIKFRSEFFKDQLHQGN